MKKTIMITTTTYRYIDIEVTEEEYFNDLIEDLNTEIENGFNFDLVFYNMDLDNYNAIVIDDYEEEEIEIK